MKSFSALYMRPWIVLKEYKCVNLCVNYPLAPSSKVFCFDLGLAFAQLYISYFKNHKRKKTPATQATHKQDKCPYKGNLAG